MNLLWQGLPQPRKARNLKASTKKSYSAAPFQQGLTQAEARSRLASEGFNELPRARRRSSVRIVFEVLREPMLALLIAGGVVYLLLGDLEEALVLLAFACLSVGITVVQEARTERVLEALRDLTSPRALVIRGGERQRIAGREVVRGDLIVLSEGDRVPADARLLVAEGLSADESLLTGEAVPVRKMAAASDAAAEGSPRPGGEDLPMVFSGSLIVRGSAIAEVTATGPASEIGKIGASLAMLETDTPHLQRQMRRLVIAFATMGAAVSVAVVVLYGLLRGGWLEGVLAGIAVGMSMLPEEFPMVLAVFMAMGAWRISKVRVLTRRASAIETLGAASVLCTDKTGTLTENRMTIAELRLADGTAAKIGNAPLARSVSGYRSGGDDGLGPRTIRSDGEGVSRAGTSRYAHWRGAARNGLETGADICACARPAGHVAGLGHWRRELADCRKGRSGSGGRSVPV